MPKLSNSSLEKRFTCSHCGKSFRTRQGLSGHIQFKHPEGQELVYTSLDYIVSRGKLYEAIAKPAGVSMSEIRAKQHILNRLMDVKNFCEFVGFKVQPQDLKNYVIMRLAHLHSQEL